MLALFHAEPFSASGAEQVVGVDVDGARVGGSYEPFGDVSVEALDGDAQFENGLSFGPPLGLGFGMFLA